MVISTESFPESAPAIDESSIHDPEPCPPAEPANQPLTFNVEGKAKAYRQLGIQL